MMNNKFFCGELNLIVSDFNNGEVSNLDYYNQFYSAVKAEIVLTMPNGEVRVVEVGEFLKNHQIKSFDRYDECEIVEQFEMDGHLITI
jgi:hypothetical protein